MVTAGQSDARPGPAKVRGAFAIKRCRLFVQEHSTQPLRALAGALLELLEKEIAKLGHRPSRFSKGRVRKKKPTTATTAHSITPSTASVVPRCRAASQTSAFAT